MADKSPSGGASGNNGRLKNTNRSFSEISNPGEIDRFLESVYSQHGDMSPKEYEALEFYKGNGFVGMNAFMRDPATLREKLASEFDDYEPIPIDGYQDMVKTLVNAPTKALGQDVMLYRGLAFKETGANELRDFINDRIQNGSIIGSSFTDKGFGSTTIRSEGATGWPVRLEIRAPKETQVWVPPPSMGSAYEKEVLLKNNTKYTITGYKETITSVGERLITLNVDLG